MEKIELKVGDKVFHKSDYTVIWVIERIDDSEVFCSTLLKESKKLLKENFSLVSIEKVDDKSPSIIIGNKRGSNYF
jgi:hypothetical protein